MILRLFIVSCVVKTIKIMNMQIFPKNLLDIIKKLFLFCRLAVEGAGRWPRAGRIHRQRTCMQGTFRCTWDKRPLNFGDELIKTYAILCISWRPRFCWRCIVCMDRSPLRVRRNSRLSTRHEIYPGLMILQLFIVVSCVFKTIEIINCKFFPKTCLIIKKLFLFCRLAVKEVAVLVEFIGKGCMQGASGAPLDRWRLRRGRRGPAGGSPPFVPIPRWNW